MRKPYFRKDRQAWYVKAEGGKTQIRLHEDEAKAYEIWQELLVIDRASDPGVPVAAIAEKFLRWAKDNVATSTYAQYSRYVAKFCNTYAKHRVRDLIRNNITDWLAKQTWGDSGKRTALTAIKRCFSWAVEEGLIRNNPCIGVKGPPKKRREHIIVDTEHAKMMQAVDKARVGGKRTKELGRLPIHRAGAIRQVLIALRHSGARPGSIRLVKAENVTPAVDAWVLHQHKTATKTNRPLIVRLSPCLQTLTRILLSRRPTGYLFLNSSGKPWTRNAIRCRMRRLRSSLDLPAGAVAYAYRHSFATQAIVNGVDLASVAELMGHKDLRMLSQHYGHLEKQPQHLMDAVAKATGRA